jgi:serine/threonine protein kinase
METKPQESQPAPDRLAGIERLIDDIRLARGAGKNVDDEAIAAAYPQWMPELGRELEKLRRIEAARTAVEKQADTDASKPPIQAAGYSILRELSRGGQAVVYLALQLSTGRNVALKVMREGPLADERALARFKREAQALAALNHPNIVTILDTGRTRDGSRYIAMNYIAGFALDEYMKYRHKKDQSDPSKLLRLFLKICAAVNAAHVRGIVHRDLKPGNIRIDERGEPHILDFGLARTSLDKLTRGGEPISITGEFLGSLPWSSPEQAEGEPEKIDPRTDVYSLGVILYQMVTGGRFPYQVVGNMRDVLNNILTVEPTPPSLAVDAGAAMKARESRRKLRLARSHPAAVNEAIERVVLKALAKQREQRYSSAGELAKDVANYLAGLPTLAGRASPRRGNDVALIAGVSVGAVALIAIVAGMIVYRSGKSHSQLATDAAISPPVATLTAPSSQAVESPPTDVSPAASATTGQAPITDSPPSTQVSAASPAPPDDAEPFAGHHYKFIREQTDWNSAAARCKRLGGHLAWPTTVDECGFLQQLKGPDSTAWIGGYKTARGDWLWSNGLAVTRGLVPADANKDGFNWLFMMRNGKLSSRPESGNLQGASIPTVEGFLCQWDP